VLERASDADRMAVLDVLRDHCAAGTITLAEFSDRCGLALEATGHGELAALTGDLPALRAPAKPERVGASVRFVGAVFGTNRRRARWRVGRRTTAVAVFGAAWVDLRHAQLTDGELTVWALPVFGTIKVIVPDGIGVDLTGVSIFGSTSDKTAAEATVAGAPVIKVRGWPIFGSVRVASQPPPGG
jgi:hypothetical protein